MLGTPLLSVITLLFSLQPPNKHNTHSTLGNVISMCNSETENIPPEVNQCFEIGEQLFIKIASTLDKRIRNIDKRRTKLLLLDDEFKQGRPLNEDQQSSLAKLPVIEGNIEMAREMVGIMKDSSAEYSSNRAKFVVKKPHPKKEEQKQVPKVPITDTLSQLLQFHAVLTSFAKIDTQDKTAIDYMKLELSDNDLSHLRSFIELTQLSEYPTLTSLHSELPAVAKHMSLLLDSSKDCFQDRFSYKKLNRTLLHLSSLQSLSILEDMTAQALAAAEEYSDGTQEAPSPPPPPHPPSQQQHKPSAVPDTEPQFEEPILSQTILSRTADPLLTDDMFMSSASRLPDTDPSEPVLIQTTVFVPSEVDSEPECISKPTTVPSVEIVPSDPPPARSQAPYAPPYKPEEQPVQKSGQASVVSFSGINIPNIPMLPDDDFDFLHDSELPTGSSKPFPMSAHPPTQQSSLFGVAEASDSSSYSGSRLQDSSYKSRSHQPHSPAIYPARHSGNYPPVNLGPDIIQYGQKESQLYMRSNQSDSSLPFRGMVVENSASGGSRGEAWDSK